jgi:aminoglycoside phosphotransferase (APT) family kinase protein
MTDINAKSVSSYLSGRLTEGNVEITDIVEHVEGWSRDTVSFTASWNEDGREVQERLVVRSESTEQSNSDLQLYGEIETEFHAMDAVQSAAIPVPETYWYEPDDSHVGGRFFLVEHIPGEAPITWSPKWRSQLHDAWDADERTLPNQFVDAAAGIHSVDPGDVEGIEDVPPEEVPEREIERWESLYRETALFEEPLMEEALEWLKQHKPTVKETTLVHGDFRIGNMLIEEQTMTGVLDWEFARAGDPLFDLGYASMDYYAGKLIDEPERSNLACSLLDRDWFYEEYEKRTGRTVVPERIKFWRVLSIFLVITMCVGGMRRYHENRSDDVRNVWFQYMLPGLRESLVEQIKDDRT